MTEQEAEWLEQACFVEEDFPHSKFLNRVSRVARRARHAFQQSVQADGADICPHCGRLNKLHCGCNEVAE